MIIIYDFDGTLTPYGFPQYKILNNCGYNYDKLKERVENYCKKNSCSLYESYFKVFEEILKENSVSFSKKNIIIGSDEIKYNKGVIEYFQDLNYKKTGVRHIILTSGIKNFIESTQISKYVDEIYGTEFKEKDGVITGISKAIDDKEKAKVISQISKKYDTNNIIYVGDGLTDIPAFEYVTTIGGSSIFVGDDENDIYSNLKSKKVIENFFERDFRLGKDFRNYIEMKIEKYKYKWHLKR